MVALSAFAAIFAATGGGPGTATEILNLMRTGPRSASSTSATARRSRSSCWRSPWRFPSSCSGCGGRDEAAALLISRPRHRCARGVGVPGALGAADLVQDRARRARLSAEGRVHADARELSPTCCSARRQILPNLLSSFVVAASATLLTIVIACRLRMRSRGSSFPPSAAPASMCWPRRCCRRSG